MHLPALANQKKRGRVAVAKGNVTDLPQLAI
jgi:hypothetical protein